MTILITGAAGFIGSTVVDRLLSEEHRIVAIDNFDDTYDPRLKENNIRQALKNGNFTLIRGDIRDENSLQKCFLNHGIDTVIHLAAKAGVRPSLRFPALYYDVNVMGTLRLLEAMRRFNVLNLIFGSSSSVYGNNNKVPFSESDPVDGPISPYAASKKAGELLAYTYHAVYGFNVSCLRFFTVYGPRQRPEMAIRHFVKKILDGEEIILYGDGTSVRDYTYIEDIVDGVRKSIDRLKGYEIINLGESQTVSLRDLISHIETIAGKKAVIRYEPMQAGDVRRTYADISKARKMLGYAPAYSIAEGLKKFVEWYKAENGPAGA